MNPQVLDLAQMEDLDFTECEDGILFGKYTVNCGVIQFLEGKKKDRAKILQFVELSL